MEPAFKFLCHPEQAAGASKDPSPREFHTQKQKYGFFDSVLSHSAQNDKQNNSSSHSSVILSMVLRAANHK